MAAPVGNKYGLGNHNAGSPAMYENPEEIKDAIQSYFDWKFKENGTITVSGLAYWLGFESRQSLQDYKEKQAFTYIIKSAVLFIESCYEEKLSGTTPTGAIFALKNMGWKDKIETELSGGVGITWNEVKKYGSEPKTDDSP